MHGAMGAARHDDAPAVRRNRPTHDARQEVFGTIQEVVRILDADPTTDWSKVNIAALREHLIDMNEVTLRAVASKNGSPTRRRYHHHRRGAHTRRDQAHGARPGR